MSKRLFEQLDSVLITEDQIIEKFELSDDAIALLEIAAFMETKTIEEGLNFGKLLGKLGLKAHKGTGIIQVISRAGKNIGELFWYLLQAQRGDEAAKIKVKEIASKKIKKEDIINFILMLDQASLHLLSGPLHTLSAITGIHIEADLHKIGSTSELIKKAVKELEDASKNLVGKLKDKMVGYVKNIKTIMSLA